MTSPRRKRTRPSSQFEQAVQEQRMGVEIEHATEAARNFRQTKAAAIARVFEVLTSLSEVPSGVRAS